MTNYVQKGMKLILTAAIVCLIAIVAIYFTLSPNGNAAALTATTGPGVNPLTQQQLTSTGIISKNIVLTNDTSTTIQIFNTEANKTYESSTPTYTIVSGRSLTISVMTYNNKFPYIKAFYAYQGTANLHNNQTATYASNATVNSLFNVPKNAQAAHPIGVYCATNYTGLGYNDTGIGFRGAFVTNFYDNPLYNFGSTAYFGTGGDFSEGTSALQPVFTKPVDFPSATNHTYNGSAQYGVSTSSYYTITGTYFATNVGTYTAYLTPASGYAWSDTNSSDQRSLSWSISRASASSMIVGTIAAQTYTGSAITPTPVIVFGSKVLTQNTDYKLTYSNNTTPGNATISISGMGNFTGTKNVNFTISRASIANATIVVGSSNTYSGSALEPSVAILYNSKLLTAGSDYTVSYKNNINASEKAEVVITGKGNFSGSSATKYFTISPLDASELTVAAVGNQTYTGSAITPKPEVKYGDTTLTEDTDYTLSYKDNIVAGTKASVTVTGKNNFSGTTSVSFTINSKSLSNATITFDSTPLVYKGSAISPEVTVVVDKITLTKDTDYTVAYANNINVGDATAVITGKTNYKDSAQNTYTITTANISLATVTGISSSYVYTGSAISPTLTLTFNGAALKLNTDYSVNYSNNINVTATGASASAVIVGKGNFSSYVTKTYKITPLAASSLTIAAIQNSTYTGSAITPKPVVKFGSVTLTEGTDYTLSYSNNVAAGTTAKVTVTGKNNFTGTKQASFTILSKSISSLTATLAPSSTGYTGKAITPTATVMDGTKKLTIKTDYTVAYSNNTNAGIATATISGTGNYSGTKTVNFTISKVNQNMSIGDCTVDISLNGSYTDITNTISGTLYAPMSTFTFTSSNTNVISQVKYESNQLRVYAKNIVPTGSITINYTSNGTYNDVTNFNAKSGSFKVTVKSDNGFYVQETGGKAYYSTLSSAITASGNNGTVYVKGTVNMTETVSLPSSVSNVTITSDPQGGLIAKNTSGNMFSLVQGKTLTIDNVDFDGKGKAAIIDNNGGTLNVTACSFTGGYNGSKNGGVINSLTGNISVTDCSFHSSTATNGGAIFIGNGTLTVSGSSFEGNSSSANGGAICVDNGTLNLNSSTFEKNTASGNGGAIYLGGSAAISVEDSSLIGNTAQKGGAVYATATTATEGEINIKSITMSNNHASSFGGGIALDGRSILLNGTDGTSGMTDSIGIVGGNDSDITVTQGLNHNIYVEFENPSTQMNKVSIDENGNVSLVEEESTKIYVNASSETGLNGTGLKAFFRVVNSGYTFNGTASTSSGEDINGLIMQESMSEVARVYVREFDTHGEPTGNKVWKTYYSLQQAINEAAREETATGEAPTVYLVSYQNDNNTALSSNEIEITQTIKIPENANITFASVLKHTVGANFTYEAVSTATTLVRGANLTSEMISIPNGSSLTLGESVYNDYQSINAPTAGVTFDGGAIWSNGVPTVTDDQRHSAGSAVTGNSGITAHAPVIVNAGTLNVNDGTVIRNNDNNYAAPNEGFGSQNYGGGIRNEGAGALNMTGGSIIACYSREGGAIMNVNKPKESDGSVNPDYVAPDGNGIGPVVTISGGTITNNASQMKGAAIQTIYGGATTVIKEQATITNNHSLTDLGSLSVEEGGSLSIEGGTVLPLAANSNSVPNTNAVYIYNKYSKEDYANATNTPYIEGADNDVAKSDENVAHLKLSGNPILANVHIDKPIYVVDTATKTDSDIYYEPVIDAQGLNLSGTNSLVITTDSQRSFGSVVKNVDSAILDKITIATAMDSTALDGFLFDPQFVYYEKSQDSEGYDIKYSGLYLNAEQTTTGILRVSAQLADDIDSVSFDINDQTYTLTHDASYVDVILTDTMLNFGSLSVVTKSNVTVTHQGDTHNSSLDLTDASNNIYALLYGSDGELTEIQAPSDSYYYNTDNERASLSDGEIPYDLAINEQGYARIEIKGEVRDIYIGIRRDAPTQDEVNGDLTDFTDSTLTIVAEADLEYILVDENGELVGEWQAREADGKVVFSGLDADTAYTVIARRPSVSDDQGNVSLPSLHVEVAHLGGITDGSSYTTLTVDEAKAKSDFELAYDSLKAQLKLDDENIPASPASSSQIQGVLDLYAEITSSGVLELQSVIDMKASLDKAYHIAVADEWIAKHLEILELDKATISNDNLSQTKTAAANALADYDLLTSQAKERIATKTDYNEKHDALIENKKQTGRVEIQNAIDSALERLADEDEIAAIARGYLEQITALISDGSEVTRDVDLLVHRAENAILVRAEYDSILNENIDKISTNGLLELQRELSQRVAAISVADTIDADNNRLVGIVELHRKESKGIVEKYYDDIVADFGDLGINEAGVNQEEITAVKEASILALDTPDTKELLIVATDEAILDLDKITAITVLKDYLYYDEEGSLSEVADIADLITNATTGAEKRIYDATNADDIDKIVDLTKLDIEQERSKDNVQAHADGNTLTAVTEIVEAYTKESGVIDTQAAIADVWRERDRANAAIDLEIQRDALLNTITTSDPRGEEKKSLVNGMINDGLNAVNSADTGAEALRNSEEQCIDTEEKLQGYDALHFETNHTDILSRELGSIQADDLAAIDSALSDLTNDYIIESQDSTAMDTQRNNLLDKKKMALIDSLEDMRTATDSNEVRGIFDSYIAEITAIDLNGQEGGLAACDSIADDSLDTLFENATIDVLFQRQKDMAKQRFTEAYEAILCTTADNTDETIIAGRQTLDNASDIDDVNAKLIELVKEVLDSLLVEGDSANTIAIVTAMKDKADSISQGDGEYGVGTLPDGLDKVKSDIEAMRASERAEAKSDISDYVLDKYGESIPDDIAMLIEKASEEIDNGTFVEYPHFIEQFKAKTEIYDHYAELIEKAQDAGFGGLDTITTVKYDAYSAIDEETQTDKLADLVAEKILKLDIADGKVEISNYIKVDDSAAVIEIVRGTDGTLDTLDKALDLAEIRKIIADAKTEMDARRYLDQCPVIEKVFADTDIEDKAPLADARTKFEGLPENVSDFLDDFAINEGYTDFDALIEDKENKIAYEEYRDEVIQRITKLVREHDGERVRDTLAKSIEAMDNINYEPLSPDRDACLSDTIEKLEKEYEDSKLALETAQAGQRVENQIVKDATDRTSSSKYNDEQKQLIDEILAEAQDKINSLDRATTENADAIQFEIDNILDEAKRKLDEVPIITVVAGDISPDKAPGEEGGKDDYDGSQQEKEIWGIVTNDASMPGGIQLVIEKTDNKEKVEQIQKAAENGNIKIAEDNTITADPKELVANKEMKSVLDIYLLKGGAVYTEFNDKYVVKILLPQELRSAKGLQVVYVADDGSIEVFDTTIEDGKYMVFVTNHFSEFYVLGEPEINLWWLIILLAVVLLSECIAIYMLAMRRKKDGAEGGGKMCAVMAASVIIPESGIILSIILGALVIVAAAVIVVLVVKGPLRKAKPLAEAATVENETSKPLEIETPNILASSVCSNAFYPPHSEVETAKQGNDNKDSNKKEEATLQANAYRAKEDNVKEEKAAKDKAKEDNVKEEAAAKDKAKEDNVKEEAAAKDKAKDDNVKEDKAIEEKPLVEVEKDTIAASVTNKAEATTSVKTTVDDSTKDYDNDYEYEDYDDVEELGATTRVSERLFTAKYARSHISRLMQAGETEKEYYSELRNEIEAYDVKGRTSWKRDTFRKHRVALAALRMRGKTLCLYLPLNADDYRESKYKVEDVSTIASNAALPCLYRIKNGRRFTYAKTLIQDAMTKHGLSYNPKEKVDYAGELVYADDNELLAKKLIKLLPTNEEQEEPKPKARVQKVSVNEAKAMMTDEVAVSYISDEYTQSDKKKQVIVNIDALSSFFKDGETVSLREIKKRIPTVSKKATYLKILARGTLDKALIVKADDFSADAVKMIVLTGGQAIRTSGGK